MGARIILAGCAARGLIPTPLSKEFFSLKTADFRSFSQVLWMGPSSKDFFGPKWKSCLRIFGKKSNHLCGTSLYALTCEYLPPPTPGAQMAHETFSIFQPLISGAFAFKCISCIKCVCQCAICIYWKWHTCITLHSTCSVYFIQLCT